MMRIHPRNSLEVREGAEHGDRVQVVNHSGHEQGDGSPLCKNRQQQTAIHINVARVNLKVAQFVDIQLIP